MGSNKNPTSFDALPLFLTVSQVAAVLGIGKNTTYDMIRRGQIHSIRAGRQLRIPKEALKNIH